MRRALRKGLRSEAIQLAEIEPKLLDVVAFLDFPERDPWLELANRSGIAPPMPLMLDVASELNEAYAVEQPLAALLQRHRLLALAHGPLSARIEVLRGLADGDANNPVWQDDLLTFEKERQNQIKAEVEMAPRKGDTAALAALEAELLRPRLEEPAAAGLGPVGRRRQEQRTLLVRAIAVGRAGCRVGVCRVPRPDRPRQDRARPLERNHRQLGLGAPREPCAAPPRA